MDDELVFYLPSEEEIENNYTMAISYLYASKACFSCKLYDGKNQDFKCENLKVKQGIKLCYKWRGIIETCD